MCRRQLRFIYCSLRKLRLRDHGLERAEFSGFGEGVVTVIGKQYLRLDSARNNPSLERYYTNLGFVAVGSCQEGEYQGILRQKEIRCQNSENGLE